VTVAFLAFAVSTAVNVAVLFVVLRALGFRCPGRRPVSPVRYKHLRFAVTQSDDGSYRPSDAGCWSGTGSRWWQMRGPGGMARVQ